jgi:flagellar basal-body rod protein FlgF
MAVSGYVAISAQRAAEVRLEAIATNIANMNTAGFRAAGVRFSAEMAQVGDSQVAYASPGDVYVVRQQGPVSFTGNALDVAVDGEGWFGLDTPQGTVYTRDGRFHMTAEGELHSVNEYPVVDAGGSPIVLDPSAGPVQIAENGAIVQGGRQVGVIGLFLLPDDAKLTRFDNSAVRSDKEPDPVEDMTSNGVRQGYVEGSNVNPILEMTRMIEASRAFEMASAAVQQDDENAQTAIRTLSPT